MNIYEYIDNIGLEYLDNIGLEQTRIEDWPIYLFNALEASKTDIGCVIVVWPYNAVSPTPCIYALSRCMHAVPRTNMLFSTSSWTTLCELGHFRSDMRQTSVQLPMMYVTWAIFKSPLIFQSSFESFRSVRNIEFLTLIFAASVHHFQCLVILNFYCVSLVTF